jgi:hypothetical protein
MKFNKNFMCVIDKVQRCNIFYLKIREIHCIHRTFYYIAIV